MTAVITCKGPEGRAARLARHGGPLVSIDVSAIKDPDCGTVDQIARVRLTARRLGYEVELRNVPAELHELLDLAGLCKVVGCGPPRPVAPHATDDE